MLAVRQAKDSAVTNKSVRHYPPDIILTTGGHWPFVANGYDIFSKMSCIPTYPAIWSVVYRASIAQFSQSTSYRSSCETFCPPFRWVRWLGCHFGCVIYLCCHGNWFPCDPYWIHWRTQSAKIAGGSYARRTWGWCLIYVLICGDCERRAPVKEILYYVYREISMTSKFPSYSSIRFHLTLAKFCLIKKLDWIGKPDFGMTMVGNSK